ncbi:MAG: TRAP transporter small permease [Rhizobiaceae bacterium]|nr:TRAP transporter small permease [Rhizobiaceae bacterium]
MLRYFHALDVGFGRLYNFLIAFVAGSIGIIVFLIPFNLFLIKMNLGAIWWLHEAIEYALYVGVFVGSPWALRQGAHVKADVISGNLPPSLGVPLDRIINLVGAGICLALCIYGFRGMVWEFQDGTYPPKDLRIANWYMLAVFSFSFFLLTVEFIFRVFRGDGLDQGQFKPAENKVD